MARGCSGGAGNEGFYHPGHGRWTFRCKNVKVPRGFSKCNNCISNGSELSTCTYGTNGDGTCALSGLSESVSENPFYLLCYMTHMKEISLI